MIDFFIRTVGKENVSEERVDLETYATDASRANGITRLVVWPENGEQVHQIILFAKRANLNLIFRGAGTNLVGSTIPDKGVVIDMCKMNKVLEIGKDYVVAEAGATVDDINRRLKDRFFPIVPYSSSIATIGGMISTNAGCSRSLKYGRMKEWVIETEIIDGTGRTKKSNDVIGKEGMLGVILKAKLKLTEKINETSLTVFKFESAEELAEKAIELKSNEKILSMEFFNEISAKIAGLEEKYYLIVEYLGDDGKIIDKDEKSRILGKRERIASDLIINGYSIEEDVTIPIENLAEFLYWAKHKKVPCFGHIGFNIIHPYLKSREETKSLYEIVWKLSGEVTGEYGIGLLKKDVVNASVKEEFMKLKKVYDPDGLFNMGKIIDKVIMKEEKPVRESRWRKDATRKL